MKILLVLHFAYKTQTINLPDECELIIDSFMQDVLETQSSNQYFIYKIKIYS